MKGMIDWFARNGVAANLMMAFILLSGVLAAVNSNEEVFPEMELDSISVEVQYLGAAPEEVEAGGPPGARGPRVRYHREMAAAVRRRPVPAARRRTATAGRSVMRARTGLVARVALVLSGSAGLAEQAASGREPAAGIRSIGDLIGPEDPETLEVRRAFRRPRTEGFASSAAAIRIGGESRPGTNRGGTISGFPPPHPGTPR